MHLLKRYMARVIDLESIDFIDGLMAYETIELTEQEAQESVPMSGANASNRSKRV